MSRELEKLIHILDAYGAEEDRWPAEVREELLAFLANSEEGRRYREQASQLDALLDTAPSPRTGTELIDEIVAALPQNPKRIRRRQARRILTYATPLAAAAALALWILGPGAPELLPNSVDGRVAVTAEGDDAEYLLLASSGIFSWEMPSDTLFEVDGLDPLNDVPTLTCEENELGCLEVPETLTPHQVQRSRAQRMLT